MRLVVNGQANTSHNINKDRGICTVEMVKFCCVLLQSCVGLVDDEEKYDEDDPTKNYEVS